MTADAVWTDERVEILKKRWAEGFSATQIAERFGDISRSAVLGKINRLGLARQPLTDAQKAMRRLYRRPRGTARFAHPTGRPASPELIDPTSPQPGTDGRPGLLGAFVFAPLEPVNALPISQDWCERQPSQRVALLDLGDDACRWPIGDPKDQGFHFCGCRKAPDISYCHHHARQAYQPAGRRRAA